MKTGQSPSARVAAERKSAVAVRLVESPAHRKARVRQQRKQQKRENQVMTALFAVVGFVTTLGGLYVGEHSALNSRERLASRLAVDNARLQERIAAINTEADRLKLTMAAPSPEKLEEMGLEYSKSPDYLKGSVR